MASPTQSQKQKTGIYTALPSQEEQESVDRFRHVPPPATIPQNPRFMEMHSIHRSSFAVKLAWRRYTSKKRRTFLSYLIPQSASIYARLLVSDVIDKINTTYTTAARGNTMIRFVSDLYRGFRNKVFNPITSPIRGAYKALSNIPTKARAGYDKILTTLEQRPEKGMEAIIEGRESSKPVAVLERLPASTKTALRETLKTPGRLLQAGKIMGNTINTIQAGVLGGITPGIAAFLVSGGNPLALAAGFAAGFGVNVIRQANNILTNISFKTLTNLPFALQKYIYNLNPRIIEGFLSANPLIGGTSFLASNPATRLQIEKTILTGRQNIKGLTDLEKAYLKRLELAERLTGPSQGLQKMFQGFSPQIIKAFNWGSTGMLIGTIIGMITGNPLAGALIGGATLGGLGYAVSKYSNTIVQNAKFLGSIRSVLASPAMVYLSVGAGAGWLNEMVHTWNSTQDVGKFWGKAFASGSGLNNINNFVNLEIFGANMTAIGRSAALAPSALTTISQMSLSQNGIISAIGKSGIGKVLSAGVVRLAPWISKLQGLAGPVGWGTAIGTTIGTIIGIASGGGALTAVGAAVGGTVGGIIGGIVGSSFGPVGTLVGSTIGSGLFSTLFGWLFNRAESAVESVKNSIMNIFSIVNAIFTLSSLNLKEWSLDNIVAIAFAFITLLQVLKDTEFQHALNTDSQDPGTAYQYEDQNVLAASDPILNGSSSSYVLGPNHFLFDETRIKQSNIISDTAYKYINKLEQGFWNLYNKPISKDFHWNDNLFNEWKNCDRTKTENINCNLLLKGITEKDLYLSTQLIIDTYTTLGLNLPDPETTLPSRLQEAFTFYHHYIDVNKNFNFDDLVPGFVVFFTNKDSTNSIATHVGILASIDKDYLKVYEANSIQTTNYYLIDYKSGNSFNSCNGHIIIGFGYPDNFEQIIDE